MQMRMLNKKYLFILLICISIPTSRAYAENFIFTNNLTIGVSGKDVSVLQQFLITNGFLKSSAPTSYFGPLTKTALSVWQAKAGISPAVGFFGAISRGIMNSAIVG